MRRALLAWLVAALGTACSTAPVVYSPTDAPGAAATGSVRPLREMFGADATPVRLVFVHGVGDHCAGYALGNEGWLRERTLAATGLRAIVGTTVPTHDVNVSVFMGGPEDVRSKVRIAGQSYRITPPGSTRETRVDAIEITWSPLTQWLKSNQLGYDSPSTTPAAGSEAKGCTEPPDLDLPATAAPPPRLPLDRTIKEQVFDRNLADAILYSGTYGKTMERGLAEALCHALTATPDDVRCVWPRGGVAGAYRYVFVTHSLGSRMVYDMFLDLLGYQTDAKDNPFSEAEREAAADFVSAMLADTSAFYMMANQLALLGLADVPPTARSGSGTIHPYAYRGFERLGPRRAALVAGLLAPTMGSTFGDVIARLAMARQLAARSRATEPVRMQIVAFNDTNDLLTWHIPRWYVNADVMAPDGRPLIDVVNVFVQNAPKLLLLESPAPAHERYFQNPSVWSVIACGAAQGAVVPCPAP